MRILYLMVGMGYPRFSPRSLVSFVSMTHPFESRCDWWVFWLVKGREHFKNCTWKNWGSGKWQQFKLLKWFRIQILENNLRKKKRERENQGRSHRTITNYREIEETEDNLEGKRQAANFSLASNSQERETEPGETKWMLGTPGMPQGEIQWWNGEAVAVVSKNSAGFFSHGIL